MSQKFLKKFLYINILFISFNFLISSEDLSDVEKIKMAGIPAFSADSDRGVGGGLVGSIYWQSEKIKPYKKAIDLQAFFTTKMVQSHYIKFDWLNPFDTKWRITSKLGFFSSFSQNYCGKASKASCDEERAKNEARILNLNQRQEDEFLKHYYHYRLLNFYGGIMARYQLFKGDAKWELLSSIRGNYYSHRDFKEKGPYKNSLFAKDFGQDKIDGYLSTLELGLMLDKRDIEASPTTGYWAEGTLRGGSFLWGSSWDYLGFNLAYRFYIPFDDQHKIVLASQSIADGIIGDLPYEAMAKIGGSKSLDSYSAFGGQYVGRGLRDQLIVGRYKLLEQLELRYTFLDFSLLKQDFALSSALFGDTGMVVYDNKSFIDDFKHIYTGFGTGLRIHWNQNFIIRADLGLSPVENFSPRFYLVVGNVF